MKHSPNANEIIENLGSYDSMPNDKNEILIALNLKRLRYWIGTEGVVINPWVQKLLGKIPSSGSKRHPSLFFTQDDVDSFQWTPLITSMPTVLES